MIFLSMTFRRAYLGAYLAVAFPKIADFYERVSGKEIPFRNNAVVFAEFPRRENYVVGARFLPRCKKMLEQRAEIG